eukprot:TRINITY_DN6858_c1_g2_i1.p1 TRINITY_DN6858_c1_g2~~TRINITY_DN6858_c1_g2_i1.p1  ORF type:complete len:136 (-),score=24.33 TRINITY_DN6858_c1_g2_i1:253-660(-)
MESYFRLAGHYHAQSEPAYCGIAVLCMVLNSLSLEQARLNNTPWHWYSEEMMSCCVPLDVVKKDGIDFDIFVTLATRHGLRVVPFRSNQRTQEEFRLDIMNATKNTNEVIVASYNRASLGQTGSGHFCPIVGYHP